MKHGKRTVSPVSPRPRPATLQGSGVMPEELARACNVIATYHRDRRYELTRIKGAVSGIDIYAVSGELRRIAQRLERPSVERNSDLSRSPWERGEE